MKNCICFLLPLLIFFLTGCTSSLSSDHYTTRDAGTIHRVVKGVVINSRRVTLSNSNEDVGIGALTGGALGAIAGSRIGQGSGSLAAGIGGALLGGLTGHQVQRGISTHHGIEYIIKLNKTCIISIVQGYKPVFCQGQHVLIQYGINGRARIIEDPDYSLR